MLLRVTKINPAGNTTLLVEGHVKRENYAFIAIMLMEKYNAEQVGYIVPCNDADIGLIMMGGEFCGNAMRSAGYFYGAKHGVSSVKVRISGCDTPMTVTCDLENGKAETEMPLPVRFDSIEGMSVAVFDGIAHCVCRSRPLDKEYAAQITREMCEKFSVSASGIMFLEHGQMRPAVYVRDTDTLFFENSCASGSAAMAAITSNGRADGTYSYILDQPGGSISAKAVVSDGKVSSLFIGGRLSIDESFDVVL